MKSLEEKKENGGRWLLLIHQIPARPSYLRVRVRRSLQKLGAVPIKNSVYALPNDARLRASLDTLVKEIEAGKGGAFYCEANLLGGIIDQTVINTFNESRGDEFRAITVDAKKVAAKFPKKEKHENSGLSSLEQAISKLRRRFTDVAALDFFSAPAREACEAALNELEHRFHSSRSGTAVIAKELVSLKDLKGRTWVTRQGIHADRMACAWLIRRFIDPEANFKFVDYKHYKHRAREIRFDMVDAEFTHVGDLCSFEVLIDRMNFKDKALRRISEIIHDIDIKDNKHQRSEAPGIEHLIKGLVLTQKRDQDRMERSSQIFDDLYEYFKLTEGGK